jgi:hypothetical protein
MPKSNDKKSRKQRSDKFLLTLHKTGQYCKKIKGKIYYFGTDKKDALVNYLPNTQDFTLRKTNPMNRGLQFCNLQTYILNFKKKELMGVICL